MPTKYILKESLQPLLNCGQVIVRALAWKGWLPVLANIQYRNLPSDTISLSRSQTLLHLIDYSLHSCRRELMTTQDVHAVLNVHISIATP